MVTKIRAHLSSILILSLIIFTSCGGSAPQEPSGSVELAETDEYQMYIPPSWNKVDPKDISTSLDSETYLAYRSTLALQGIYSKLTIIKEELLFESTSLQYAERNIDKAPLVLSNYTKLQVGAVELGEKKEATKVHIFEAKPGLDSPIMLYIQMYVVKDKKNGYTITFSTTPTEKNYQKYLDLLQTFTLKDPSMTPLSN